MPDYFVNVATGSDANPGTTMDRPLRSITAATLRAGDAGGVGTIHVGEGIHSVGTGERFPIHLPPGYSLRGARRDLTIIRFTGASRVTPDGVPCWGGVAVQASGAVSDLTIDSTALPASYSCNVTIAILGIDTELRLTNVMVRALDEVDLRARMAWGIAVNRSDLAPRDLPIDVDASSIEILHVATGGIFSAGEGHIRNSVVADVAGLDDPPMPRGIDLVRGGEVLDTRVEGARSGINMRSGGLVRGCTTVGSNVNAATIEDCEFTDSYAGDHLGSAHRLVGCGFVGGGIMVGTLPLPAGVIPTEPCLIADNELRDAVLPVQIARTRNFVFENNTIDGVYTLALRISEGAAGIVRNNTIGNLLMIYTKAVILESGARAAFEGNTIAYTIPGTGRVSHVGYAVMFLRSLTTLSDGRVLPGADFGGGFMGSRGGNRFGQLIPYPDQAPIQVEVPGDSFFNGNYWHAEPGSEYIFPPAMFDFVEGAVVHTDGGMPDRA